MTNRLVAATFKLLAALVLDAILLALAIMSGSAQVALLVLGVGILLVLSLLFSSRWRYVGMGMIMWAALGIVTEVALLVMMGGGE